MPAQIAQFFKASVMFAAIITGAALAQGCVDSPVDPDPGYCDTSANMPGNKVGRPYAEMVCQDWVRMLLTNCVEVMELPLNPTEAEIGSYCARAVNESTNSETGEVRYSYTIEHACNFIDNPSYECTQYEAEAQSNEEIDEKVADFRKVIASSQTLSSAAEYSVLNVNGKSISLKAAK